MTFRFEGVRFEKVRLATPALRRADARWRAEFELDVGSLGIFRIVFVLYVALMERISYCWISELPAAFFLPHPLTLSALTGGFPGWLALEVLDYSIIASLGAVLVGFRTRLATAALLLLTVIGDSYRYSFGKIDHGILFQCVLLVMIRVNWGQAFSYDAWRVHPAAPSAGVGRPSLRSLSVVLALAFATAGLPKVGAWVDFDADTSGFLSWLYSNYYLFGRTQLLADWAVHLRPLWIWEAADIGAVTLELGFLFAMLRYRSMLVWLALAAAFHLVNCLLLSIPFHLHAICYLAYVPWLRLFPVLASVERSAPPLLALLAGLVMLLRATVGHMAPVAELSTRAELGLSVAIWTVVFGVLCRSAGLGAARRGANDAALGSPGLDAREASHLRR